LEASCGEVKSLDVFTQQLYLSSPFPCKTSAPGCILLLIKNLFVAVKATATMSSQLAQYKLDFLNASISGGILKFGTFELKSKRISPYFFNAGLFHTARLAGAIATAFAHTIVKAQQEDGLEYDIVFGPAYKGIPLSSSITVKLGELNPDNLDTISYSFDRKEAKDHGEGGNIVGAPLKGKRILIVDDVITAGTAKREAIEKIQKEGGIVVGIVVAVDRMEKLPAADGDDSKPGPSAIGELKKEFNIPIYAILNLDDIIDGMKKTSASPEDIKRTEEYRSKYKATD
jgi:orotate phosphoribosyltransferase